VLGPGAALYCRVGEVGGQKGTCSKLQVERKCNFRPEVVEGEPGEKMVGDVPL
jgi:hypothetical protein